MSEKPTNENEGIKQFEKAYEEAFGWIREFLKKFYTIDELLKAVSLLHNAVAWESLNRAAELGEAKQQFQQMLMEEIRRRKSKHAGLI